jgi:hypothetical protein
MAAKTKAAPKKVAKRKPAAKRELIDAGTNKLFARRPWHLFPRGRRRWKSLAADRRQTLEGRREARSGRQGRPKVPLSSSNHNARPGGG